MRKKLKRPLLLLLAVWMLVACACSPKGPEEAGSTAGETGTDGPGGSVSELLSGYTIVYPTAATAAETAAAMRVVTFFGSVQRPKADYVAKGEPIPQNNREILIGNTNRASSQAALAALEHDRDYSVSFYEGEVVIAGGNDAALTDAVEYFIGTVLPADAADYPVGTVYTCLYPYPLTGFFGLSLAGLEISYTATDMEATAALLQAYIHDASGADVDISYLGDGNIRLTLDQTMDKSGYAVDVAGGRVTLRAGSALALSEAVKAISAAQMGNEAASFTGVSSIPVTVSDPKSGKTLELVWHDEFEGTELNNAYWKLQDKMWKNSVVTTTDKKNITVENGEVVMQTYREGDTFYSHKTLTTMDRMSFQYGYLEIYAKVPFTTGSFPSFWLQSAYQHRTVDYMTEVDVFEVYTDGYVEGTMHKWYLEDPVNGPSTYHCWNDPKAYTFPADEWADLSDEYHLWGFGWTATEIYFTVDGKIYATFDITDSGDFDQGLGKGNLTGMSGFQDPMIINFTNWIGSGFRDPDWVPGDETEYPMTFSVAWIRLYQDETGRIYNDFK